MDFILSKENRFYVIIGAAGLVLFAIAIPFLLEDIGAIGKNAKIDKEYGSQKVSYSIGQEISLLYDKNGTSTVSDYNAYMKYDEANDNIGIAQMKAEERLVPLAAGTKIKLLRKLSVGLDRYWDIRVLSKPNFGKELYIAPMD
jgi:hypothetical protein